VGDTEDWLLHRFRRPGLRKHMNDDILIDENAVSLSINVSRESDAGLWSSEGGELGSPFSWINDESS
jgi:hypothetical protein